MGGRDTKKKQISGFYERGKKEEVLTSDEKGDEKKREISLPSSFHVVGPGKGAGRLARG